MSTALWLAWAWRTVLVLGAAWALYRLALRSERCFGYNRVFLLVAPLVAAGLPLLPLAAFEQRIWPADGAGAGPVLAFVLPAVRVAAGAPSADWLAWPGWWWLYVGGAGVSLGRLAYRLWRLHGATRHLPRTEQAGYVLVHTSGQLPTSSFGRAIFWDDAAFAPAEAAQVLAHEAAHVRQGHTYDVLWLEIWQAVLWFNPFVYPLRRALAFTHELLADRAALAETAPGPPLAYAKLLARLAMQRVAGPGASLPLLHSFTHSLTLNRIAMLKPTPPVRRWKQWLALPALAGLLTVACQADPSRENIPPPPPPPMPSPAKVQEGMTGPEAAKDKVYIYVEEMPHLPGGGGVAAIVMAIQGNLKYPSVPPSERQQGRVFVSFIVTKDGQVADPKVVKGIGAAYDAAVVAAIQKLPRFVPGQQNKQPVNVSFTVPIMFGK